MYVKAFAKINIYLDVVSKRDDGYHELEMVMLPLELHDTISLEFLPYLHDTYITCDHVELRETKYNLIKLTLDALRKEYGFKENFNIKVHKEIPIQAGLGGGSSNAAAVMKGFNKILKLNMDNDTMNHIGKTLGADVPFCLLNKPAAVYGIGEKLEPIKVKNDYFVIIIKPKQGLSTKHVFEKADTMKLDHGNINDVIKALESGDDTLLEKSMFNSLEKPSMEMAPEVIKVKDMLRKDGFKLVLMSGSGSCVYAMTTNLKFAKEMSKKYEKQDLEVYLTRVMK